MRNLTPTITIGLVLIVALALVGVVSAQTQEFIGFIDSNVASKDYLFEMQAGQSVLVTAEATSGDLDTFLIVRDPQGNILLENDDRNNDTLDSAIGFTATESGIYTVTVSRYEFGDSSGDYLVRINVGDSSVLASLDTLTRLELSGTERIRDTEHFRIHYTLEGIDSTTETYAEATANSMELIYRIQVEEFGWPAPPPDGELGGDSRYDVYLADLVDDYGDGALGYASPQDRVGDNINSERIEQYAATSYLAIENDFTEMPDIDMITTTPQTLMRATAAHEFHHAIQFGFDVNDIHNWYYEATAVWMETVTLAKDEDASGYVSYNYDYPELCFGTTTDPRDGQLQYGDWTFIQMLADDFGDDAVQNLWGSIAEQEGFAALQALLAKYEADIPSVLANYRLKNLVRDYDLAGEFQATVWLENSITNFGRWSFTGEGIQELAANYFELLMPAGVYQVNLVDGDNNLLQLWAVGINGTEGVAIPLNAGGTISTSGYEHVYLMVFNPVFDEDVDSCVYSNYSIEVQPGSGSPLTATQTWNAEHFEPLHMVGAGGSVQSNLANN